MSLLYFDPGLGAMVIQGLVAVVAGVVLFSKSVMHKLKVLLGFKQNSQDDFYDDINVEDSDVETKKKNDN